MFELLPPWAHVVDGLKKLAEEISNIGHTNEFEEAVPLLYEAANIIGAYDQSGFDVLNALSSRWWGKQVYFLQDNGTIYSRIDGEYLPDLSSAVESFASKLDLDN